MAEARHGIRLSEPLNHWLRKSFDSGIGLDASDLLLLSDCMTAMATVAAHLDESTSYFVVHDTLRARISRAEHDLDRRIAEASEHSSRTGMHALADDARVAAGGAGSDGAAGQCARAGARFRSGGGRDLLRGSERAAGIGADRAAMPGTRRPRPAINWLR